MNFGTYVGSSCLRNNLPVLNGVNGSSHIKKT